MFRIGLLILIVASAVLLFTNPGYEAHKQVVYATAATGATKSELIGKIAADLLEKTDVVPLKYNNYFVCSTTSINGEIKSVGTLSRVWEWRK